MCLLSRFVASARVDRTPMLLSELLVGVEQFVLLVVGAKVAMLLPHVHAFVLELWILPSLSTSLRSFVKRLASYAASSSSDKIVESALAWSLSKISPMLFSELGFDDADPLWMA